MATLRIRDARILTLPDLGAWIRGDVVVEDGVIVHAGPGGDRRADRVLEAGGAFCLPGLVQTHVHLCQTLMRGLADDLTLLDWLEQRVWPLEAAHTRRSIRASARLGIAELLLGGTTTVLSMETVRHTDAVFKAVEEMGIRAVLGKTHMDRPDAYPGLREDTRASLEEAEDLCRTWHGRAGDRIRYAYAPRFALSCTRQCLEATAALARRDHTLLHTHAGENPDECARVEQETGLGNIEYLDAAGCLGENTVLAHCIHLSAAEVRRLADTGTRVAHCPTCNLKLGSGIADVPGLLEAGVSVSLGADGAPCNNALDMFEEMKLAALVHKVKAGAGALPAPRILDMATLGGARALHLEDRIGTLEPGKRGDVVVVAPSGPRARPLSTADPASLLVYAGRSHDVKHVVVDGEVLVEDRKLLTADVDEILAEAETEALDLRRRAGV